MVCALVHLILKEFVDQYDNTLRKKVENENVDDFNSFNATISCVSRFPLEKQFQKIYTHAKLKEVPKKFTGVLYCSYSLLKSVGEISTYQVIERVEINDAYMKKVHFHVKLIAVIVGLNQEQFCANM
jgi:hypothetical protein